MLVAQLCPTLCDSVDCSLPGSSFHGILQARILEWVTIPFSRGSSQFKDWTQVSCIAGGFLPSESWGKPKYLKWVAYPFFRRSSWPSIWARVSCIEGRFFTSWANLPAVQETGVWSLGREDPLEKEMANHSSILACKIPCSEGPGGLQSMESQELDIT